MMMILAYLVKFSVALSVTYGFYALVLQRLTFYKWNRLFLQFYSIACFFLPLVDIDPWLQKNAVTSQDVLEKIPSLNNYIPVATGNIDVLWIIILFGAGSLFCMGKLVIQYLSYNKIKRSAVLLHDTGSIRIYSADASGSFSLGNNIYIDTAAGHSPGELERVLQHEMIHVIQHHWIDLAIGEMLCIINWFNPFTWRMRAAIRRNLEFIADRQVLQKGYDTKSYQYLLLKVANLHTFRIAAHFSLNDLKKRINMMNKIKSARVHLIKFVFILPLMAMMLLAFRTVNDSPLTGFFVTSYTDTIPPDDDSMRIGVAVTDKVMINDNNFNKQIIFSGGEEIIVLQNMKSKEIITMTMKEWNRNKRANERKYGKLPKPPVPPKPPVQPVPPVAPEAGVPVAPPVKEPVPPVPPAPPAPDK